MKKHDLKVWMNYYEDIETEKKNFELRYNDRNFQVGDKLILREYNEKENYYTDRSVIRKIGYILSDTTFGLKDNWIVIGFEPVSKGNE
jgi:hypothetical protein